MFTCARCNNTCNDGAKCSDCNQFLDFPCSGITEAGYRRLGDRQKTWRCNTCKTAGSSPRAASSSQITEVLNEIRAFRSDFLLMKSDVQETSVGIQALNTKWSEMETRFSDMEDRLIQVEAKLSSIPKLQKQLDVANDEINTLKSENNNRDQYSRMNNLEISGVPYYKGENLFSIF
ncbi:unnamed protein product [Plutella xylostella]|uniref:(diamondback moth) hypothetical protein n=1 Tax=Plutella xylostella TaxID=51655 RepID=A0A8S4D6V6_PLUXY|nr:unnamed protein product [Plutella xylostella]